LKELKNEHDNIQRNNILKSSHINQVDGDYNTIQEKYQKLENDLQMMTKVKNQLEENVKTHNMEMQKFQFEYEDQLAIWKKEKSEM
jgi:chromosome segregation ATPase